MPVHSIAELGEALATLAFNRILGAAEGDWIDFKGSPYGMVGNGSTKLSPKGKWELCKDVAELANHHGGCLLIGVETVKNSNIGIETASAITPVRKDSIDISAYRSVISQGMYPNVRDLRITWHSDDATQATGLLLIEIPPPDARDQPHVMRRMVDDSGKETGAVGVPVRNGDQTDWYSAEQIHHLIRNGMTQLSVVQEGRNGRRADEGPRDVDLDHDIGVIQDRMDWDDRALYLLQAQPPPEVDELPDFYGPNGVAQILVQPSSIRSNGFNLSGLRQSEFVDGALLAHRMDDAAAYLEPSGLFTIGVVGSAAFLGWGVNPEGVESPIRINSTTLVEFTYEFFRFVHYALRVRTSPQWRYRVLCLRFQSADVRLTEGPPGQFPTMRSMHRATADRWEKRFDAGGAPGEDAFQALRRVYNLFNLGEESIPYSVAKSIDEEQIRALR